MSLISRIQEAMTSMKNDVRANAPIFPVWAEENSSIAAGALEWAFGNGANTPQNQGITIPFDCELFAGSLSLRQGTGTVGIYRNGTKVFDVVSGSSAAPNNSFVNVSTPIAFSAGDVVGFRTTAASGTNGPNTVCAWFRKV